MTAEALEQARRVLDLESQAIARLHERLGAEFLKGVEMIGQCQGRVVVTGMGKSGLIGRKLAATSPASASQPSSCIPLMAPRRCRHDGAWRRAAGGIE
jgi:arabinose-5-phosphate isomerase